MEGRQVDGWSALEEEDIELSPATLIENRVREEAIQQEETEAASPEATQTTPTPQPTSQPEASTQAEEPTEEPQQQTTETQENPNAERIEQIRRGTTLKSYAERYAAVPTGVLDFGVDLINVLPGVNVPKLPAFELQTAQAVRNISSVVVPTMVGAGALKGVAAASHARVGWSIGNLPAIQWLGNAGVNSLAGVGVGAVSSEYEGDNALGTLKKNVPSYIGDFIPDSLATVDGQSPDEKRWRNVQEDLVGGNLLDVIGPGIRLAKGLYSTAVGAVRPAKGVVSEIPQMIGDSPQATAWLARNSDETVEIQQAKNLWNEQYPNSSWDDLDINQKGRALESYQSAGMIKRDATEDFINNLAKREESLDELGSYNLSQNPNTDVPLKGVHDVFDYQELGMRQVDEFGIVGASVDNARIAGNKGTVDGRLGNFISEPALKYISVDPGNIDDVSLSLAKTLQDAGEISQVGKGWKVSYLDQIEATVDLAGDLFDPRMSRADIQRIIEPLTTVNASGAQELTEEGYGMLSKALRGFGTEITSLNYTRAQSLTAGSLGGRIADLAEGMRYANESVAIEGATEKIVDLMKYIVQLQGSASYYASRKVNLLSQIKNGFTNIRGFNEATVESADAISKELFRKAERFGDSVTTIAKTDPSMMKDLLLGYEMTKGKISTLKQLNDYIFAVTGDLGKGILDMDPQTKNFFISKMWNNIQSSMLSAFRTPIDILTQNAAGLASKPIAHFGGALIHGDLRAMQRNWMAYGSLNETMGKSLMYAADIMKKASVDPNAVASVTRRDLLLKQEGDLQLVKAIAESRAQQGDDGLMIVARNMEMLNGITKDPILRLGTNSAIAADGLTGSMIGHSEAYFRAMDRLVDAGQPITRESLQPIVREEAAKMFDDNGLIRDEAVKWTNNELTLNLDSPLVAGLGQFTAKAAFLKPFTLFPTSGGNRVAMLAKYSPGWAPFMRDVNQLARTPLKKILSNVEFMDDVLTSRGIDISEMSLLAKQNRVTDIKYETMGRQMIGMAAVSTAMGLVLNSEITGTQGLANKQAQAARVKNTNWKSKMIKLPNGKSVSYEGLGVVGDWLGLTVDIADNFNSLGGMETSDLLSFSAMMLAANLTDRTGLSTVKPLIDMLNRQPGSFERWSAGFLNSMGPLSAQRREWSRVFGSGLNLASTDIWTEIGKSNQWAAELFDADQPYVTNPISGKVPNRYGMLQRLWNAYTPFDIEEGATPEQEFVREWGYDYTTTFDTIDGVKVPRKVQAELFRLMGEQGIFRAGIKEVMVSANQDYNAMADFKELQAKGNNPEIDNWMMIHDRLKAANKAARENAIAALNPEMSGKLALAKAQMEENKEAAQRGREAIDLQRK